MCPSLGASGSCPKSIKVGRNYKLNPDVFRGHWQVVIAHAKLWGPEFRLQGPDLGLKPPGEVSGFRDVGFSCRSCGWASLNKHRFLMLWDGPKGGPKGGCVDIIRYQSSELD